MAQVDQSPNSGRTRLITSNQARDSWTYLSGLVLSTVATWLTLGLGNASWGKPWIYQSDGILAQSWVKTVVETGWYEYNPLLNAPQGQVFHDWGVADNLIFVFAKVASLFTQNPFLIVNIYYFAGFVFASITAIWFFRLIGIGRILSVGLSILYALAPYHLARGEVHLILSAYWPVPLALGIVFLISTGKPLWMLRKPNGKLLLWGAKSAAMTTTALLLTATANNYYGIFVLLLIAFFGVVQYVITRNHRQFLSAVAAGGVVFLVLIVNMLPDLVYAQVNGSNYFAVQRIPFGVEFYSLRLTELLLPNFGHRVPELAGLRDFYMSAFNVGGEGPVLGLWASIGFLSLVFVSFAAILRKQLQPDGAFPTLTMRALAAMNLFVFLLATVGGLSSIIGLFTSSLRGWNRVVILIALLSLAMVGVLVQKMRIPSTKLRGWDSIWLRNVSLVALTSLIVFTGYLDQVNTNTPAEHYKNIEIAFNKDAEMVQKIERISGKSASVVQLPYRDFPESAGKVPDTDQIRPSLHSATLKWTAGGIKGRPTAEWVKFLEQRSGPEIAASASSAGFAGILLDRVALDEESVLPTTLRSAIGEPAFIAQDGRYEYFNLKTTSTEVLLQELTLSEQQTFGYLTVNPVAGSFLPPVDVSFNGLDLLKKYAPRILIDNPQNSSTRVQLEFEIKSNIGATQAELVVPESEPLRIDAGDSASRYFVEFVAPPGRSELVFERVGGADWPDRTRWWKPLVVENVTVTDLALAPLLARVAP